MHHWKEDDIRDDNDNDKDTHKDKDKDKDKGKVTKRPNLRYIFENDMTQGCQIDVLHENFWKQPKVSISKLLRNLEKYSDLLVCYRTADCFLFYTYLKKFIAICYTQTHTGHSHSKKLSLQWLSTVTSNARENRYKFYTRERQSRECTAKKYRGKIHLHTKQRAGILPPSDFHLISSRGASCGCWEGAPS